MKENISLVIFDMDGLMFDTEKLAFYAWQKVAEKYGYLIENDLFIKTLGIKDEITKMIFKKHFGKKLKYILTVI